MVLQVPLPGPFFILLGASFVLQKISVLLELPLGHLRYRLTDVPPQPNSPPDNVFNSDRPAKGLKSRSWTVRSASASLNK